MPLSTLEQHRNRRDAKVLLAKLAGSERSAEIWETCSDEGLRTVLALGYRRRVGVVPVQRHELRRIVEAILRDGHRPVAEIVQEFEPQSQKPSSSP